MIWMLKDSKGTPSFTVTASALTLGVVLAKVLLGGVVIGEYSFGPSPDSATIAALLTPTLLAYTARRHSDNVTKPTE
jgi:hypothetical protein